MLQYWKSGKQRLASWTEHIQNRTNPDPELHILLNKACLTFFSFSHFSVNICKVQCSVFFLNAHYFASNKTLKVLQSVITNSKYAVSTNLIQT